MGSNKGFLITIERCIIAALVILAVVEMYVKLSRTREGAEVTGSYPYAQNMLSPDEMGVSTKGNYTALGNDVDALQGYVDLLISGDSTASDTGGPMGNAYFLDTGGTCTTGDTDSNPGNTQQRYYYMNNIPTGNNFLGGEGLVPGIIEDIEDLNPSSIFSAFSSGSSTCREIEMLTRDNTDYQELQTRYVNDADIENLSPCWFASGTNPVSGLECSSSNEIKGFTVKDMNGAS
jgi:hypothetical protein